MNSLYFTDSLPSILCKPPHHLRKMLFAAACTFACLAFSGTAMAQCNTPPTAVADTAITPENRTLWIAQEAEPPNSLAKGHCVCCVANLARWSSDCAGWQRSAV